MAPFPLVPYAGLLLRELTFVLLLLALLAGGRVVLRDLRAAVRRALIPVHQKGNNDMGYLNRVVHLGFPDLAGVDQRTRDDALQRGMTAEDADNAAAHCWVKIKNPRLMSADEAFAASDGSTVTLGPDGQPTGEVKQRAVYETVARLVIAGNVWDVNDLGDDPALIPMPLSPDDVGKMPTEVITAISRELAKINPK